MNPATKAEKGASTTIPPPLEHLRALEARCETTELALAELCALLTHCEPRAVVKPLYEVERLGLPLQQGGSGKPNLATVLKASLEHQS